MKDKYRKLLRVAYACAILAAFAFAGNQAYAGSTGLRVCDGPGEIGVCGTGPGEFNEQTCNEACFNQFGTFGGCNPEGCCMCAI